MNGSTRGRVCPVCGQYALEEPGGIRCLVGGHMFLYRRVLPKDHWLSGHDWKGRKRQTTLDRCFMNSGRVHDYVHEMLERLEGRPKETEEATAPA